MEIKYRPGQFTYGRFVPPHVRIHDSRLLEDYEYQEEFDNKYPSLDLITSTRTYDLIVKSKLIDQDKTIEDLKNGIAEIVERTNHKSMAQVKLELEYFNQRMENIIETQVNMTDNLVYNDTFD